jgi:hypothetical protein
MQFSRGADQARCRCGDRGRVRTAPSQVRTTRESATKAGFTANERSVAAGSMIRIAVSAGRRVDRRETRAQVDGRGGDRVANGPRPMKLS